MANVTRQQNQQKGQDKSVSEQTGTTRTEGTRRESAVERSQTTITEPVETTSTRPAQRVVTTQTAAPTVETTTEDYAFTLAFSLIIKDIPCEEIP